MILGMIEEDILVYFLMIKMGWRHREIHGKNLDNFNVA